MQAAALSGDPEAAAHPIAVEPVSCPDCGSDAAVGVAQGPDYDEHRCAQQLFTLVQCLRCDVYYLNPRPTLAMLPLIYGEGDYYAYDFSERAHSLILRARNWRNKRKVAALLKHAGLEPGATRVLEIGPGDGALLHAFRLAGVPAQNIVGMDFEARAIEVIQRLGFRGVLGRVEDTQLDRGSFDVVLMMQVIEHVADPRQVMRSVHRLLRDGGVFFIETPNMASWDRRFFRRKTWGGYHFPRHFTLWTAKTMSRMLRETGFKVESVSTPDSAVLIAWSLKHALEERGASPAVVDFFSDKNPALLAVLFALDLAPSVLGKSANMRLIARAAGRT
jgi:2-polyprenyl-3-methyl-5-hydroxy-6-metoxy-1,4-benzoquinol methylase